MGTGAGVNLVIGVVVTIILRRMGVAVGITVRVGNGVNIGLGVAVGKGVYVDSGTKVGKGVGVGSSGVGICVGAGVGVPVGGGTTTTIEVGVGVGVAGEVSNPLPTIAKATTAAMATTDTVTPAMIETMRPLLLPVLGGSEAVGGQLRLLC